MLPNGSASGCERMIACPASVVLPQSNRSSDYSERGHDLHSYVRRVLAGSSPAYALSLVSEEHRDTASRIDCAKLGGDLHDVRAEVAYALNPVQRTARELGVNIGRRYDLHNVTDEEIAGSDDVEGTRFDGVPVIGDVKSGYEQVTAAEENAQLFVFAAAKAWTLGAPEVEVRIWHVQPDGHVRTDSAMLDAMAIDSFGDELEDSFARVAKARAVYLAGGPLSVTPGSWCRYCPSMPWCPEYTRLARAMVPELSAIDEAVAGLTLEQAGAAWLKAKTIEGLLDRVLEALKARAREEPLPIGGDKVIREVRYDRQSFTANAAIAMLRSKGATEPEIASLYRTTEVTQVKETNASGKRAKKRSKAA